MEFQRATRPLVGMFDALERGSRSTPSTSSCSATCATSKDHVIRIVERGDTFRQLLQNALQVHSTLVGAAPERGDRERSPRRRSRRASRSKKISSWAAIMFAPTLIAAVYGMNFVYMPELGWTWGYPFAVALMLGFAGRSTSSSSARAGSERMPRRGVAAIRHLLLPAASDRG